MLTKVASVLADSSCPHFRVTVFVETPATRTLAVTEDDILPSFQHSDADSFFRY